MLKWITEFGFLTLSKIVDIAASIYIYLFVISKVDLNVYGNYILLTSYFNFVIPLLNLSLDTSGVQFSKSNSPLDSRNFYYYLGMIRSGLLLLVVVVICMILYLNYSDDWLLVFLCSWPLFWNFIYPSWLYIGLKRFKSFLLLTLFAKLFWILGVSVLWSTFPQMELVAAMALLSVVFVLVFVFIDLGVRGYRTPKLTLIQFFRSNQHLAYAQVFTSFYTGVNRIIIGNFIGLSELSIYDFTDKIYNVLRLPVNSALQLVFTRLNHSVSFLYRFKTALGFFLGFFGISLVFYLFKEEMVYYLFKEDDIWGINYYVFLHIVVFFVTSMSGMISTLFILEKQSMYKRYLLNIIFGSLVFIGLLLGLLFFGELSLLRFYYCVLISETIILISFFKIAYEDTDNYFRTSKSE